MMATPSADDRHAADSGRLRPRGSSQGGLRQYNERVVLQAIRLHGALPAAEIARLTGLTAQTVSQITKRLLDEGLLRKGAPVRGKVGQPSVPLALAPDGAYAIGIKVGRRSLDVLLVDFTGAPCRRATLAYDFPEPDAVLAAIDEHLRATREWLGPGRVDRLQGIGIAAPLSLGGWQALLGVEADRAGAWDRIDLTEAVGAMSGLPVSFVKDTAAACVAELVAGRGRSVHSFLYVFVDTFIGGGLVLDSHLRGGLSGNAGAVGSLAMGRARPGDAPPPQLLSVASLFTLERMYVAAGLDPGATVDERALQPPWRAATEAWLAEAAPAIALALHDAACLLDLEGVIVDGQFSRELLASLLAAVKSACAGLSWEGVRQPALMAGTIGPDARALGGALLPLHANFAPDRALFLKLDA